MGDNSTIIPANQLTEFEKKIYQADPQGVMVLKTGWKPVIDTINGEKVITGYFSSFNGWEKVWDREGKILLREEAGLESPWISPIDFIGPGLLTALARSIGLSVGRVAFRSGITAVTSKAASRSASVLVISALSKMRAVAARLLLRKTVETVSGPMGSVPRSVLLAAMKSAGSTITVTTRLTMKPQVGKALSVAVGDGASALAGAARSAGMTYSAKIPMALIVQLEKIGLASLKITRMGNVVGKEYRFLEGASEFIVTFFK